jgi:hypothetical protein
LESVQLGNHGAGAGQVPGADVTGTLELAFTVTPFDVTLTVAV